MITDEFKYLREQAKPKTSIWKYVGWTAYVLVALLASFLALTTGFWPGFVVVLAVIFGPKLWSNIR